MSYEWFYGTLNNRYALPTRQLPLPREEAIPLAIGTDLVLKLLFLEVWLVAVDVFRRDAVGKMLIARDFLRVIFLFGLVSVVSTLPAGPDQPVKVWVTLEAIESV